MATTSRKMQRSQSFINVPASVGILRIHIPASSQVLFDSFDVSDTGSYVN